MLEVKKVSKSFVSSKDHINFFLFKKKINVLKNFSFKIYSGEIVKLEGSNGVGKTTFLRILANLIDFDAGEIIYYEPFKSDSVYLLSTNDRSFFLNLSVFENLNFFYYINTNECFPIDLVNEYLERYSCTHLLHKPINELSSGQKKIIMIIRTLIIKPQLLLLDELFTGMDYEKKITTKNLIQDYVRLGNSVIYTSHEKIHDFAGRSVEINGEN